MSTCSVGGKQWELYFEDGQRRIDYVIILREDELSLPGSNEETMGIKRLFAESRETREKKEACRQAFLDGVFAQELEIEREVIYRSEGTCRWTIYKIHLPWSILIQAAENSNIHMPVHEETIFDEEEITFECTSRLQELIMRPFSQVLPTEIKDYYRVPFRKDNIQSYVGHEDQDAFFTPLQRGQVALSILDNIRYGQIHKAEVGINRMVAEEIYDAAFPLHEGDYECSEPTEHLNRRQILYEYWAKPSRFHYSQPLDHVEAYFGVDVAFYFAWLGFYKFYLVPSSIAGVLVFVYAMITVFNDEQVQYVCEEGKNITMCPTCETCDPLPLSASCSMTMISYMSDNFATAIFSLFICVWAIMMDQMWPRQSAAYAYQWDVFEIDDLEERPRPKYAALATEIRNNPVTGQKEPFFPKSVQVMRKLSSLAIISLMIVVVLILVIGVIVYRIIALTWFSALGFSYISSASAALLNLIFIMLAGLVYNKVAMVLNDWEMHRTEKEYQNSLTLKSFVFQFVNNFSSIAYIAFVKGKFAGYPGHYTKFLHIRLDECVGNCMSELSQQLAIIMIGQQVINNVAEVGIPFLVYHVNKFRSQESTSSRVKGLEKYTILSSRQNGSKSDVSQPPAESSSVELIENNFYLPPFEGLFFEYLEMVLQYGFVTIFVIGFPLAPVFALVNNIFEVRIDANKLLVQTRRVIGTKVNGIGVWQPILCGITKVALVSNAFLLAYTSEFIPRTLYYLHHQHSMDGYYANKLVQAPNWFSRQLNITTCYYQTNPLWRNKERELAEEDWILVVSRVLFVVVFEHIVFFLQWVLESLIPSIPEHINLKLKRRKYLARKFILRQS